MDLINLAKRIVAQTDTRALSVAIFGQQPEEVLEQFSRRLQPIAERTSQVMDVVGLSEEDLLDTTYQLVTVPQLAGVVLGWQDHDTEITRVPGKDVFYVHEKGMTVMIALEQSGDGVWVDFTPLEDSGDLLRACRSFMDNGWRPLFEKNDRERGQAIIDRQDDEELNKVAQECPNCSFPWPIHGQLPDDCPSCGGSMEDYKKRLEAREKN